MNQHWKTRLCKNAFFSIILCCTSITRAEEAASPPSSDDPILKLYLATSTESERIYHEAVSANSKARDEKIKTANDAYIASVTRISASLRDTRKKAMVSAIAQYDSRMKEATLQGELEQALKIRAAKDNFIQASKDEYERSASEEKAATTIVDTRINEDPGNSHLSYRMTSPGRPINQYPKDIVWWNEHGYKIIVMPGISKSVAEYECSKIGGTLAMIETVEELRFIQGLVQDGHVKDDVKLYLGGFRAVGTDKKEYWFNGTSMDAVLKSNLINVTNDNWNDEGTEPTLAHSGKELNWTRARWGTGFICEWTDRR